MNTLLKSFDFNHMRIDLLEGDITREEVDAIVNAANSQLQHGGGVAAAIAHAGGWIIQQQSNEWIRLHGPVTHEQPAYTEGGTLPCRYVIHAVGPIWGEGNEDKKLASAIEGSLRLAENLKLESLAFPSISTGIYGFPEERAAGIFFNTLYDHFKNQLPTTLKMIKLVLFGSQSANVYLETFIEKYISIRSDSKN